MYVCYYIHSIGEGVMHYRYQYMYAIVPVLK